MKTTVQRNDPSDHSESEEWNRKELQQLINPEDLSHQSSVRPEDVDFVSDCRKLLKKPGRGTHRLPVIILLCMVALGYWASRAELEEVTRGQGKVIPSSSVQVIQSLEGGIVEEMYVREGDIVEKDQPLLRIRDQIYSSSYQENLTKRDVLAARLVRLQAEADSAADLKFPLGIRQDLIELQTKLFEKRNHDHEVTIKTLEKRLALSRMEEKYLTSAGRAISKIELTRVRKEAAELEGEITTLQSKREREAMEQYERDCAELEAMDLAILRDKDRLDRTLIRSPVRGTINTVHIDSTGRVVASGVDIMEVVPLDDTLLVEANVRPSDIAFIHPGHEATVKFTAYDYSIYGGLKGKVEQISVDTITDDQGESFYQIKVRTAGATLGRDKEGKELEIIPGMVAEVDVLTGQKSVMTYLLKPINRARQKAFRER